MGILPDCPGLKGTDASFRAVSGVFPFPGAVSAEVPRRQGESAPPYPHKRRRLFAKCVQIAVFGPCSG